MTTHYPITSDLHKKNFGKKRGKILREKLLGLMIEDGQVYFILQRIRIKEEEEERKLILGSWLPPFTKSDLRTFLCLSEFDAQVCIFVSGIFVEFSVFFLDLFWIFFLYFCIINYF